MVELLWAAISRSTSARSSLTRSKISRADRIEMGLLRGWGADDITCLPSERSGGNWPPSLRLLLLRYSFSHSRESAPLPLRRLARCVFRGPVAGPGRANRFQ